MNKSELGIKITLTIIIILIITLFYILISLVINAMIGEVKDNECEELCKPNELKEAITSGNIYLEIFVPFSELFVEYKGCVCYQQYQISLEEK